MLKNCKGSQRQRLLSKFSENDYEKVDRILELHLKYLEKVNLIDKNISESTNNDDENEEELLYIKRLSGGLFSLQLIDYIIIEISSTAEQIKQRIVHILNMRGSSMKIIKNIMRGLKFNLLSCILVE